MKETCKQFYYHSCENTLSSLLVRYEDIKREYNSISHVISSRNKRSAWFGAIGTAFRHIFGTLDKNDAIKYDQAIESVQTDEKTLAKLVKENILVTTTTLSSFKETIKHLESNQKALDENIYKLFSKYNNVTNKLKKIKGTSTEQVEENSNQNNFFRIDKAVFDSNPPPKAALVNKIAAASEILQLKAQLKCKSMQLDVRFTIFLFTLQLDRFSVLPPQTAQKT
ncbi:unnamed protein product [Leptidea sinapis]|uniref:Uncharacterized protein n=1 Tax=Leptidea sinapis TaxID=189913 RepID=A0A5E4QF25_9NEOP|nr:unnamed protein product [Leptidea sinapis]